MLIPLRVWQWQQRLNKCNSKSNKRMIEILRLYWPKFSYFSHEPNYFLTLTLTSVYLQHSTLSQQMWIWTLLSFSVSFVSFLLFFFCDKKQQQQTKTRTILCEMWNVFVILSNSNSNLWDVSAFKQIQLLLNCKKTFLFLCCDRLQKKNL